jgi:hypothetical protein
VLLKIAVLVTQRLPLRLGILLVTNPRGMRSLLLSLRLSELQPRPIEGSTGGAYGTCGIARLVQALPNTLGLFGHLTMLPSE